MQPEVNLEIAMKIARNMVRPWQLACGVISFLFACHLFLVYFVRADLKAIAEAENVTATTLTTSTSIKE